jgi:hypothetical protein
MGSLNNGSVITQSGNVLRISHYGNYLRRTNTATDTEIVKLSNSGTVDRGNYAEPFGVSLEYDNDGRTFVSGMPRNRVELQLSAAGSGIEGLDKIKYVNASGYLSHQVTRAMGIHSSVSHLQADATHDALRTVQERKVFFIDSDRGRTSGFADWTIFNATGLAVGASAGTTDMDSLPEATYNII